MPDQGVAADELAVLDGTGDEFVATGVVEDTTRGFGGVPFHGVSGGQLAEVVAVIEDWGVSWVLPGAGGVIGGGAKVELPGLFGIVVETFDLIGIGWC